MDCTLCLLLHPVCTGPLPELGLAAGAPVASVRHTALALGREAVVTSIVQIADCVTNAHAPPTPVTLMCLSLTLSPLSDLRLAGSQTFELKSDIIGLGRSFSRASFRVAVSRASPGPAETREGPPTQAAGSKSK